MDIFDRLGTLIRSMLNEDADPSSYTDPDMRSAWEELDSYMRDQEQEEAPGRESGEHGGSGFRSDEFRSDDRTGRGPWHSGSAQAAHAQRVKDLRSLELPADADFESVKRAYKKLLVEYHPDRHAANENKQRIATEITQRINAAYRRLRNYYEARS